MSEENKKYSIGGSALMEGIMMIGPKGVGMSLRMPDGSIETQLKKQTMLKDKHKIARIPFIRGPINFVDQWAITGSTGTGKSTVATYSLCYELYKLMCLKNPNRFYLGANETIWILFFNLNLKLAEKTMWRKVSKSFTNVSLVFRERYCNRKN